MKLTLNNDEKLVFLNALKNSMNLTKACSMINRTPKDITLLIKNSPEFKTKCEESITTAYKALLIASNSFLQSKKYSEWKTNNELIKSMRVKLTLWEEHATKDTLTDSELLTAFVKYKENEEVATACGLDLGELAQELLNREHLRCKLEELKKVF
ncbi:MAG: hypothetical protein RLY40_1229 [Pseudomonadota bacterium]|jgi:hypothetical protein